MKANNFSNKAKKLLRDIGLFFAALGITLAKIGRTIFNPHPAPGLRRATYYVSYFTRFMVKLVCTLLLLVVCTLAVTTVYGALYVAKGIDYEPIYLEEFDLSLTSEFYALDTNGEYVLVETISGAENRLWATYDEFPQNLVNAFVAIEDKSFWEHDGVNWKRTIAAFANMFLTMKDNFGGSTITQQLIKVTTGNDEVSVRRKFTEMFQALDLDRRYSKEDILEYYMNAIFLGQGCTGVKTSAAEYFGKELSELTLLESACLAGITNNPYLYDPYTNPVSNRRRTDAILAEMLDQELITEAQYTTAMSQTIELARKNPVRETKIRSWYVEECMRDLIVEFKELYHWSDTIAEQYIFSGGLKVYMSQELAVQEQLDAVWFDESSWPKTNDSELPQSTMVIMKPDTAEIAALVGSRTPKELEGNKLRNMATMSVRQPGSSLKPLAVYGPALELGYITPYSNIIDAPVGVLDNRAYPRNSPVGYDGSINILTAITQSKNTAAIRLMRMLTPRVSFDFVEDKFHITSLVDSDEAINGNIDVDENPMSFGSLTLGASVKEMAAAYCVFPSGGVYSAPRTFTKVYDKNDNLIIDNRQIREAVISEKTAFYMNTMLKNAVNAGTGKAAKLGSMPVAGKTGTTSSDNDRWFCGYTAYYVGVCWFGYEMPRSLKGYSTNPAVTMWQQVMERVHADLEPQDFRMPPGLVTAQYCIDSGHAPTAACLADPRGNRVQTGTFFEEDVPTKACDAHVTAEVCSLSGQLATPSCPHETRHTIGLVKTGGDRLMPIANVKLEDEAYTLRLWETEPYIIPEADYDPRTTPKVDQHGWFAPYHDGTMLNNFCTVNHPAAEDPDDPGDDPDNPYDPDGGPDESAEPEEPYEPAY